MGDLSRRRTTRTNPCIYLFCHLLKMMYSARLKIISNHPLWMSISLYTVSCHLIRCICSSTLPMKTFLWSHKKILSCRNRWKFFFVSTTKDSILVLTLLATCKEIRFRATSAFTPRAKGTLLVEWIIKFFHDNKSTLAQTEARKSVLKDPFRLQVLHRTVRCWAKSNERRLHIIISYAIENKFTFCNIHKFECTRLFWFGRL